MAEEKEKELLEAYANNWLGKLHLNLFITQTFQSIHHW